MNEIKKILSQLNSAEMKKATEKTAIKTNTPDMYEVITNRIIEQLEKGVLPWCKTI